MRIDITGNGTQVEMLSPGRYIVSIGGTLDAGATVELKSGDALAGSEHVPLTTPAGDAFQSTGGAHPEPQEFACGGPVSVVTTGYGTSSGLGVSFRRLPSMG